MGTNLTLKRTNSKRSELAPRVSWCEHLGAALLIGLVLGTLLGIAEGLSVLSWQHLWGQYDELVPWSILANAGLLAAWELVTALAVGLIVRILHYRPSLRFLVALQLGLGILALVVGIGFWSANKADPTLPVLKNLDQMNSAFIFATLLAALIALVAYLVASRAPRLSRLGFRPWIVLLVVAWVGAILFGLNPHTPSAPQAESVLASTSAPRYNVLIVTIDTLRGDSIGLDGSSVQTPNLDQVGHAGTWFTNAIVQQPNTNASHTSIFTGVFPYVHGVRQHMIDRLSPDVQTLAEVLGQNGYQTAGLYSWVSLEPGFSGLRGFQTYQDLSIHLSSALADPRFQNLIVTYRLLGKYLFVPGIVENRFLSDSQNAVEDTTDGKANVTTDAAVRWLEANGNGSKPFFLWVHYYDPHYPYTPPPPFDTMYDPTYTGTVDGGMGTIHYIYANNTGKLTDADVNHLHALYDGEISFTDQQVGRLMNTVDQLGLTNNTIVVITGDHGESLGTNGRWFHGAQLNYEDIHVPLIMRFPSVIPVNHSVAAPVESIDIMPTILDMLHVPAPAKVQGKSLMPLMTGADNGTNQSAISMMDSLNQISLVTAQWHLIWDRTKNTEWLYDYHTDPSELNDQQAANPPVTAQLMQQLNDQLNAMGFKGQ